MSATLALLMVTAGVVGAPTAAGAAAYPARAVVAAFAGACRGVDDFGKAKAALLRSGWEAYVPAADSAMGKLLATGRAAVAADPDGPSIIDGGSFRRTVAGEQLELTLSGVRQDEWQMLGCRVFDFGETRAIPVAVMTALVRRAPGQVVATPQASRALWEPGYAPGIRSTELFHVPAGSPATALLGTHGIVLVAQSMQRTGAK